jgi:hypothetical protein
MTHKVWVGIDNGVTGSIGVIYPAEHQAYQIKTPVVKELSYTKKKAFITWIDFKEMRQFFEDIMKDDVQIIAALERPMINPTRFKASVSAVLAWQTTLLILKLLEIPYEYIDSKEWQKKLLPSGLKKEELKHASLDIAKRMYPSAPIEGKDADGLLIAEHLKRKYGGNND